MAAHIDSVAGSSIQKVTKDEFYHLARSGDLVFCQGAEVISHVIESETQSPFSHVLQLWLPEDSDEWLTLESTIQHGVHVGKFSEYIDKYNGDLVLTGRTELTELQKRAIRNKFLSILDDGYDWLSEVGQAAHKLLACVPVDVPKAEYYCSGSQWYASTAIMPSLQRPNPLWFPTPEDNWTDSSIEPVCALLKG